MGALTTVEYQVVHMIPGTLVYLCLSAVHVSDGEGPELAQGMGWGMSKGLPKFLGQSWH